MLINNDYNFLFVHIQKTAGSSISYVLKNVNGTSIYRPQHTRIKDIDINFNRYFKFCFVRNPWDRLVSWYNMHSKARVIIPFQQYLMNDSKGFSDYIRRINVINCSNTLKSLSFNQLDYMVDKNGVLRMDFIGRFENIDDDFNVICKKLNLPNSSLPHVNGFDHKDYREYYNDEDREYVANLYKRDIDYFGYTF